MKKRIMSTFRFSFICKDWCCLCLQTHAVILFNGRQQSPHAHLQAKSVTGVFGSVLSHDDVHYTALMTDRRG